MTTKKAQLDIIPDKKPTLEWKDGKFIADYSYGIYKFKIDSKDWHRLIEWCKNEETREMAQLWLNLLGE